MSVNKKVAKQCLSLSSLLALLKLRSLWPCTITWVLAIAWRAALANRPLANYCRKDCQSNAGVSPICAVTVNYCLNMISQLPLQFVFAKFWLELVRRHSFTKNPRALTSDESFFWLTEFSFHKEAGIVSITPCRSSNEFWLICK